MIDIERICNQLNIDIINKYGTIYFNKHLNALKFIDYCESNFLIILGIEIFTINDMETRPVDGGIADFTINYNPISATETANWSREFIKEYKNIDCYFEFVIDD